MTKNFFVRFVLLCCLSLCTMFVLTSCDNVNSQFNVVPLEEQTYRFKEIKEYDRVFSSELVTGGRHLFLVYDVETNVIYFAQYSYNGSILLTPCYDTQGNLMIYNDTTSGA